MCLAMGKFTFAILAIAAVILGVKAEPPQKIVQGIKVVYNEFPYLASLRRKHGDSLNHFCGGAIISRRHILTAAHCMKGQIYSKLRVVVGTNHRKYGGVAYSLSAVALPKDYKGLPLDNYYLYDIAILTLKVPLESEGSSWQIVKLPSQDYPAGTKVVVAGWGDTYHKSKMGSDDLLHIHTNLADISSCKYGAYVLEKYHLCTLPTHGMDTCQGDSGGPLVANGEVVGVVSNGIGCGTNPGVFTKVRAYKYFIETVTGLKMQ